MIFISRTPEVYGEFSPRPVKDLVKDKYDYREGFDYDVAKRKNYKTDNYREYKEEVKVAFDVAIKFVFTHVDKYENRVLKTSIFEQLNNLFHVDYKMIFNSRHNKKQPDFVVQKTILTQEKPYGITIKPTQWCKLLSPEVKVAVAWEITFPALVYGEPRKIKAEDGTIELKQETISGNLQIAIDNPKDKEGQSGPGDPHLNYRFFISDLADIKGHIFIDEFKPQTLPSRDRGEKVDVSDNDNKFDMFGKDLEKILKIDPYGNYD